MMLFLTALKILGTILLMLLLALLIIALAIGLSVLFVPFRYSFSGNMNDPQGSSELVHIDFKKDLSFEGEVRWFLGAVRAALSYDGTMDMSIKLFGSSDAALLLFGLLMMIKGDKEEPEEKEEKPPAAKEEKSIEDRIDAALSRAGRLYDRVDDALYVLGTERGSRAIEAIKKRLLPALASLLPEKWGLTGVIGLGDPAASAKVFAVQGFLYPVTAGHVALDTDYELYRYDLHGSAAGSIRLSKLVFGAGVRLLINKDVRYFLKRLRRGPSAANRS